MLIIILGLFSLTAAAPWTVENAADKFKNDDYGNNYAKSYQHENHDYPNTFMERKVDQIVSSGSAYLEGLRRSLNAYADKLRNCTDLDYNKTTNDTFLACRRLTKDGEKARRLSQLALWTTRKIQDESRSKLSEAEERSLLMRLAWLLEKLAKVTGYQPRPEDYMNLTEAPRPQNVTAMPLILDVVFNVSDDVIKEMVDCLDPHKNRSEPAYIRCPRARLPTAALTNALDNATQQAVGPDVNASSTTTTSSQDLEPAPSDTQQNLAYSPYIQTYNVPKNIPNQQFPLNQNPYNTRNYDTDPKKPNLPYFTRNYDELRNRIQTQDNRNVPQDPSIIRNYDINQQNPKQNPYYTRNYQLRDRKFYAQENREMPEDPQQDISAYSKFKEGTNIMNNPQQLVEATLALERHFANPNIEVVRRYGANYNPLIPNVNNAGLVRTLLDI